MYRKFFSFALEPKCSFPCTAVGAVVEALSVPRTAAATASSLFAR